MKEIGLLLKETRENLGFGVDDAAKDLKVRAHYIEVLESGDVSSVSKEIYIIGYLKSYASWLGLNSNELVAKFKSHSTNFSVASKISTETSSFFSLEEELVSPGRPVVLLCMLLAVLVCFLGSKGGDPYGEMVFQEDGAGQSSKYKGFSYKKGHYKKIILLAKDDVEVKLYYSEGDVVEKQLKSGEMHFFADERDVLITANSPAAVDVLSDDEKGSFFGTLEDLYVLN